MTDKTDDALRKYFSHRTTAPPHITARVTSQIYEAQSCEEIEKPALFVWGIVAFDFIVSFAILYVLWILIGHGIVLYTAAAFVIFSLFAVVAITFVAQAGAFHARRLT